MNAHALNPQNSSELEQDWKDCPNWFREAIAHKPDVRLYQTSSKAKIELREWNKLPKSDSSLPVKKVLLVHGHLANASWFDFVAPLFDSNTQITAMSLAGCGNSEWLEGYNLESDVQDILDVIAHIRGSDSNAAKVILVGHSLGGALSIRAAAKNPSNINTLLICDTHFSLEPMWQETQEVRYQKRYFSDKTQAQKRFRFVPLQPISKPYLQDYIALHSLRAFDQGWGWKFDERRPSRVEARISFWSSIYGAYADLTVPNSVLYAQNSVICPSAWIKQMQQAFPKRRFVMQAQAHHHMMIDDPITFVRLIENEIAYYEQGNP